MAYRAKLRFSTPEPYPHVDRTVFRLVVECLESEDMPTEIFLFRRLVLDAAQELYKDDFITICSAYDLSAYPVGEPDSEATHPYFRKSKADFLLPSQSAAEEAVAFIKSAVNKLCSVQTWLDVADSAVDEWFPDSPAITTTPAP